MRWRPGSQRGQTAIETVVLMPLFFGVCFLLLQLCMIGVGFIYSSYAASSIGRLAAKNNTTSVSQYSSEFKSLLGIGLKPVGLSQTILDPGSLPTIYVSACVEVIALPMVGELIGNGLSAGSHSSVLSTSVLASGSCPGPDIGGVIGYASGNNPHFVIKGTSMNRLNYR